MNKSDVSLVYDLLFKSEEDRIAIAGLGALAPLESTQVSTFTVITTSPVYTNNQTPDTEKGE